MNQRYLLEDLENMTPDQLLREDQDYEFNASFDHLIGMFSPAEYPGHSDDDFESQYHTCHKWPEPEAQPESDGLPF